MTTQGISLQMAPIQKNVAPNAAKPKESTFDRFMEKNASGVSDKKETFVKAKNQDNAGQLADCAQKAGQTGNPGQLEQSGEKELAEETVSVVEEMSQDSLNIKPDSLDSEQQMCSQEQLACQITAFLQETFGLSEEEIVDVLEQLGLIPLDLAAFVTPDAQILPLNTENIKAVIMEVHGVMDENAFLVSDSMCQELNDVMEGLKNLLSEEFGMDAGQLSGEDEALLQNFSQKWEQMMETAQTVETVQGVPDGEKMVLPDDLQQAPINEEASPQKVFREDTMLQQASPKEMMPQEVSEDDAAPQVSLSAADGDEIPVVVEMSDESGTGGTQNSSSQTFTDTSKEKADIPKESPIQTFTERLADSFQEVSKGEQAPRAVMDSIVQQVVRHVRIRVLPQTTSMELQLNPASLGRVHLQVESHNGTATATLTVQNQVAKEALESQIAILQESLEDHGLKVESVEVNVSEFGFKHQEDSNSQDAYHQKKSGSRRFHLRGMDGAEEDTVETEEDRQYGDSVVDYTA